jgi:hypothetical protein
VGRGGLHGVGGVGAGDGKDGWAFGWMNVCVAEWSSLGAPNFCTVARLRPPPLKRHGAPEPELVDLQLLGGACGLHG